MKSGEMKTMSATIKGVWKYLSENVPEDGRYIPYSTIRDAVGKRSRHAIAYAVEKLIRMGKIRIYDSKIYVNEKYKEAI